MSYWDLLQALRHRWQIVAAAIGLTLAVVLIWTVLSPRHYAASATLLFDAVEPGISATPATGTAASAPAAMMGTQADIIRSAEVTDQVISALGLDGDPDMLAEWREAGAKGDVRHWLASVLRANVGASPEKNSNVMAVTFVSGDPERAARIANGYADSFVLTQLRLRTEPAKVYSGWFKHRIDDARQKLERAQARLTRFQQERGLIGGEKLDIEMTHLSDLTSQLAIAEASAAEFGARARNGGSASPEVQMSGAVTSLRAAAAMQAAEVERLRATLGPNHPQLRTAEAALATMRAKLGEAIGFATRSMGAASSASAGRVADLRGRLASQRQRVLQLSGVQDELQVLQRDVNGAKAEYDSITESLSAARLKAQIPQTNVTLLDRAGPPMLPFSPNIALRLVLGLIFGVTLGVGLALGREWMDPVVRSPAGLEARTRLPTLISFEPRQPLPGAGEAA